MDVVESDPRVARTGVIGRDPSDSQFGCPIRGFGISLAYFAVDTFYDGGAGAAAADALTAVADGMATVVQAMTPNPAAVASRRGFGFGIP